VASETKLGRVRKARAQAAAEPAEAVGPTTTRFAEAPKADASEYASPERQEEILNPPTQKLTVGGKVVELHPLSAKRARALTGLVQQIMPTVFTEVVSTTRMAATVEGALRFRGIIAERYNDKFVAFIAAATAAPGAIDDAEIAKRAADIDENATYHELTALIDLLLEQNGVWKQLDPKN
jgi:hypothetical protein